ncbi:hypothetical protein G6F35_017686 [Rhizopus arrhizus]|nr:hypothetical protein G6F35_017686 [Rhizopus arrhizus]
MLVAAPYATRGDAAIPDRARHQHAGARRNGVHECRIRRRISIYSLLAQFLESRPPGRAAGCRRAAIGQRDSRRSAGGEQASAQPDLREHVRHTVDDLAGCARGQRIGGSEGERR